MVSWKCDICGSSVHGFEGERGVYHGVCHTCGRGYGRYDDDEDRMAWWEDHRHPLYAVCLEDRSFMKNHYFVTRGWLGQIMAALDNCEPGSIMTVFDIRTRTPVERMHAHIGWSSSRTISDEEWLLAHGGVA